MYIFRVRVGKRGVIVIPKEIRDSLGIKEGMVLELEVREDKIILKTKDLWSILRERGRKISFNIDEAEREIDMEEEEWLRRFQQ
ncbi:MAG TPA: AbrB/MazE/SpoVT family DNA-binding domain-containing protein [Thermoprotei archaeon]|nr:AbrB/MazE/SpoVT family DNA-binding domain-containing protein [Thermoprotei archaeon]